jgi:uncharacterized protein (TIRG00374 family)
MASRRRWFLFFLAALALGLLLVRSIRHNPQWRNFQWSTFADSLFAIETSWALGGLAAVYITYLVRALRWKALMRHLKRDPSLWNLFSASVIGFAAIGVFGRAGEMVRPYLISRKENVLLSSQIAVWLVERCFDTLTLLITAAFALGQFEAAGLRESPTLTETLHTTGRLLAFSTLALVVLMIALRNLAEPINNWIISHLPHRLARLEHHFRAFEEGTRGLHSLRALTVCILYSVAEWILMALCYYCVFNSFSGGVRLTVSQTLIFMACVMLGSVVNIPGIGGGVQVASLLVLTELFGLRPEPAASISLLIWGFTFLAVIPPAVVLMIYEGLSWSKLRRLESNL